MSNYSPVTSNLMTRQLLELAKPSLLVSMYFDEVPTNWKDKALDLIRLRRPRQTKLVEKPLPEFPKKGDTVVFRRHKPFKVGP